MQDAMFAALDPYRRIRAIVAAVFILVVTALVIASVCAPRHAGTAATAASGAAVSAPATRAP